MYLTELETSDEQQRLLSVFDDLLVVDSGESATDRSEADGQKAKQISRVFSLNSPTQITHLSIEIDLRDTKSVIAFKYYSIDHCYLS